MSDGFFPITGGANFVVYTLSQELRNNFEVHVITRSDNFYLKKEVINYISVYRVYWNKINRIITPGNLLYRFYKKFIFRNFIFKIIKSVKPDCILTVYPNFVFLDMIFWVKKLFPTVKTITYFHDLLGPTFDNTKKKNLYYEIEKRSILASDHISVINNSMSQYFEEKYGVRPFLLPFPIDNIRVEPKSKYTRDGKIHIGWAGNINNGNVKSLVRLLKVLLEIENSEITLMTLSKLTFLKNIPSHEKIKAFYLPNRTTYLNFLIQQDFLIVSLDWPDESPLGEIELKNALPTKVMDYIVAQRPIIAHCPSNYYLAKFISNYEIGGVVASRDYDIIKNNVIDLFYRINEEEIEKNLKEAQNYLRNLYLKGLSNVRSICNDY